ncbi:MAG: hypothetical protein UU24_C0025G0007 [Candidatus Nomurabacteria bacterium GW2011_GWA2_40_9]|uniref:DUF4956 domain-containing protein n=1 Tax=Candidatus Nomurabacteria bacterium GW2011_GWA2_40_9 TaxID=1618734 RepID=A0A0G0TP82_9BACT|nr:MAG: hypothetical protein UU24_C0025G0007 [Candidatus Nomurabacteria bacterium GW2011_GWA2_40_9]
MAVLNFKDITNIISPDNVGLGVNVTTGDIIFSLAITFATAMFIFYIYKKTYAGVLYSKSFNISLVATSMIVAIIMMAISGNLALSLGMVGALSIVRFRTAVKDPKDIVFLFWSISIGIINGIAFYKLSLIGSLAIGGVLILLSRNMVLNPPYLIVLRGSKIDENKVITAIKKYCSRHYIRNTTITESGKEITIEVKLRKEESEELLKDIKNIAGVEKVMMFSHSGGLSE